MGRSCIIDFPSDVLVVRVFSSLACHVDDDARGRFIARGGAATLLVEDKWPDTAYWVRRRAAIDEFVRCHISFLLAKEASSRLG